MIAFGLLLAALAQAQAAATKAELPLRHDYRTSSDPLTTETVWVLDPDELNPHRRRWLLERQLELQGLEARRLPNGRFGVLIKGIRSESRSYVRGPGPWFRPMSEFPCTQETQDWFATAEGARKAASVAAEAWGETLGREKVKLAHQLEHLVADSREAVLRAADRTWREWKRDTESEWRIRGETRARMAEWREYLGEAESQGVCGKGKQALKRPAAPLVRWEAMMEPPVPYEGKLLARAPARRWNGLFSVRSMISVGRGKLDGRFVVDSGAGMSVLSPVFLNAQGVPPAWLELPGSRLQRVSWSGLWGSEGGLARLGEVERVELSNFPLPLRQFLLFETDFFGVPENVGACCDGILGTDFLRRFVVEFHPGPPSELRVWPKERFSAPPGFTWIEVSIAPRGDIESDCLVEPEEPTREDYAELRGVRWDTGSEVVMDVHLPWQAAARKEKGTWQVSCGGLSIARDVHPTYPQSAGTDGTGPLAARSPAVNLGIPLMARGPFYLDLPHGRLWFQQKALDVPMPRNQSGLTLGFSLKDGERILKVEALAPGSRAVALQKAGLRKGTRIVEIDSLPAEEVDLWEVEHRLAGDYGDTVALEWETKGMRKLAPLKVR